MTDLDWTFTLVRSRPGHPHQLGLRRNAAVASRGRRLPPPMVGRQRTSCLNPGLSVPKGFEARDRHGLKQFLGDTEWEGGPAANAHSQIDGCGFEFGIRYNPGDESKRQCVGGGYSARAVVSRAPAGRRGSGSRSRLPPPSVTRPTLWNTWMTFAVSNATTRSQARARLQPMRATGPRTAATTGFSTLAIASTMRRARFSPANRPPAENPGRKWFATNSRRVPMPCIARRCTPEECFRRRQRWATPPPSTRAWLPMHRRLEPASR